MSKSRGPETEQWYLKKELPSAHAARQAKRISLSDLPDSSSLEHAWQACLKKRPYSEPPAELSYMGKISASNPQGHHPGCIQNYPQELPSSNGAKSNVSYKTKVRSEDPSPDVQWSRYQQNFDGTHTETQPIWLPYRPGKVYNNNTSAVEANNRGIVGKESSRPHSLHIPKDAIIPSSALSAVDQPKGTELPYTSPTNRELANCRRGAISLHKLSKKNWASPYLQAQRYVPKVPSARGPTRQTSCFSPKSHDSDTPRAQAFSQGGRRQDPIPAASARWETAS